VRSPFFSHLGLAQQIELVRSGRVDQFTAGELLPRWWRVSVADFATPSATRGQTCGSFPVIAGKLHKSADGRGVRITCQFLLEEEFTVEDIKLMLHHNPAELLYP